VSVEQYSNDVIVVTIADGPLNVRVWRREETPADLLSDLHRLCEEYLDAHVVLDPAIHPRCWGHGGGQPFLPTGP
jgi:hypothetical protein